MVTGLDAGTRFELVADGSSAGRDENCGIWLNDVSVSRIHAEFSRTANGRIAVRDLNSLNGTYVNGARVESATLSSGDEVQIGKYKLVFWEASK
jgi:pSer/pThr/pTyr-binding forkhead associated (FHA) protein